MSTPHTRAKPSCRHCGAPLLDQRSTESGFCCPGCSYVHRLIGEHGLSDYYNYKDATTPPADPAVFQPRDYGWLESLQAETEKAGQTRCELLLSVQGISCAGCVWLIERLYQEEPGALDVVVSPQSGELRLRWQRGTLPLAAFARKIQAFGYLVGPPGETGNDDESRGLVRRIGLCTAFAMNVMLFTLPVYFGMDASFEYARLFSTISVGFGTLSFLVGGVYFLSRALAALRLGEAHIDLPIAIGVLGAYLGSLYGWLSGEERYIYFDFVSTFILLMLIGRWAQVAAVERNRRQLLRHQIKPPRVHVPAPGGGTVEVPPERLKTGDEFVLLSGQASPVEARLLEGAATMSLASINGESEPRSFRAGEILPSGALNIGLSPLRLEARQAWSESLLSRLLRPGERQGYRHRFLERVIRGYLIGIFATATLGGIGWWLATRDVLHTGAVVVAVLVVSCPCAIGLSFPLAEEMAAIALRRRGVYVRENDLWAKLPRVRRIIFDKTGTLTLETPELVNPEALRGLDAQARSVLQLLVANSSHPLSQSLLAELLALGTPAACEGVVDEVIGQGLETKLDGIQWMLGRPAWACAEAAGNDSNASDSATVVLSRSGEALARFRFSDRARPDAREEFEALEALGYELSILSGDTPAKVATLATALGLPPERALGAQSPDAKAAWMQAMDRQDSLMLGDGANDSLAFDRALCRGTPVIHRGILEQRADFYYLGKGIRGIRALFEADRIRLRTQRVIIAFSIAYNLLTVGLAVAGHMNPLVAAILMPLNSLLSLLIVSVGMRPAFRI